MQAPGRLAITGSMLARNWLLNLGGQALPFLVGLASVPTIVYGLGTDRFGLLALTWSLIGAFSVFDLGLGRAVTKFVAEALGRGDRGKIPGIIWPAVAGQAALGTLGGGVLAVLAPLLVLHFLKVANQLQAEAILAIQVVGLLLPVLLVSISFQGALEAAQRFDIITGVRIGTGTSMFLVPLAGVFLRWDLPRILLVLLVIRALVLVALLAACIRVLSILSKHGRAERHGLKPMFTFGAWVTASGLTGLVLAPVDRLVIGSVLSMTALTYYTVPKELVLRLGIITGSMSMVLFPAFSALGGAQDLARLRLLFTRATRYLILTVAPVFGIMAIFAPDILRVWLGPSLAVQSAPVLRILAAGAGMQLLAAAAFVLLQGLGRSDLTGKFHLLEAPFYIGAVWWLVQIYGIQGAAFAWSGRMALDTLLLLGAARRLGVWTWGSARGAVVRVIIPVTALCVLSAFLYSVPAPLAPRAALVGGLLAVFGWWAWAGALESEERRWMVQLASGWRRSLSARG